uniref:Uncharacterized protein n=1 Tax=Megaselia scalaris TaxID=36166 RepID=T1GZQ6_MEGSC
MTPNLAVQRKVKTASKSVEGGQSGFHRGGGGLRDYNDTFSGRSFSRVLPSFQGKEVQRKPNYLEWEEIEAGNGAFKLRNVLAKEKVIPGYIGKPDGS